MQSPAGVAVHPTKEQIAWPKGVTPSDTPAESAGPRYLPLNLHYPGLKLVHKHPPIYTVTNFLTDDECQAFVTTADPLLQRSKTHAIAGTRRPPPHQTAQTRRQLRARVLVPR